MIHPYTFAGLMRKEKDYFCHKKLMSQLIETIAKVTKIPKSEIMANKRKRHLVQARQILSYMLKKTYNLNLVKVGYLMNKHHSTIIHLLSNHEQDYKYNELYRKQTDLIINNHMT